MITILGCNFSLLEKLLLIDIKKILFWNKKRWASHILYHRIIILILQLLRHPSLRHGDIHPLGDDKHQAKTLGGRSNVGEHYQVEDTTCLRI